MPEIPGAYNEARNRIREKKEQEVVVAEALQEHFEKSKEKVRKKKTLDVFELKRLIETGRSLDSLSAEIQAAIREGSISPDSYKRTIDTLEKTWILQDDVGNVLDPDTLPFSQNALAKYLENQKLWENIWADMVWFLYGLIVQGSAILVIIAWKILTDAIFLPRDIYREYINNHH